MPNGLEMVGERIGPYPVPSGMTSDAVIAALNARAGAMGRLIFGWWNEEFENLQKISARFLGVGRVPSRQAQERP